PTARPTSLARRATVRASMPSESAIRSAASSSCSRRAAPRGVVRRRPWVSLGCAILVNLVHFRFANRVHFVSHRATRSKRRDGQEGEMHELVIRGGRVVDGTGAPARTADVAIDGGRITEVGRVDERGRRELEADGLVVAPGWVDIHTHYDGQVTWAPELSPSSWHRVTPVAMA